MARQMSPLSPLEQEIARKLSEARFPPYSASKRFAREMGEGHIKQLSTNGRRFLAYVVHRFRRQYQLSAEEESWVAEWLARAPEPAEAKPARTVTPVVRVEENLQLCLDL